MAQGVLKSRRKNRIEKKNSIYGKKKRENMTSKGGIHHEKKIQRPSALFVCLKDKLLMNDKFSPFFLHFI